MFFTEDELSDPDKMFCTNDRTKINFIFEQCWNRWRSEYLPSLREAHIAKAMNHGRSFSDVVKLGDVVLVHSEHCKRSQWPLAVVTKFNHGNDGLVRSVEIKTHSGTSNIPIAKLYPPEVTLIENYVLKPPTSGTCDSSTSSVPANTRP